MSALSLDDLAVNHPVPEQKSGLQELFVSDFGEITGDFVEKDGSAEFHATLDGRPVVIQMYRSRVGQISYVINGNTWHPPGSLRAMELDERQAHLVNAVRRYM